MLSFSEILLRYRHLFNTDYTADPACLSAWLFDEASGTTITDASVNALVGSFKADGEPLWSVDAPAEYAAGSVYFDGNDDYIDINAHAPLDTLPSGSFTICLWTYNYTCVNRLVDKRNGGGGWYMGYVFGNAIDFYCDRSSTASRSITIAATLPYEWQHITAVHVAGQITKIYIDGVLIDNNPSYNTAGSGNAIDDSSRIFAIGNQSHATFTRGNITEVGIFSRALNSIEINEIIEYGLKPAAPALNIPTIKNKASGYNCFMANYITSCLNELAPARTPDGTIFT